MARPVSTSITSARPPRHAGRRGFTLVELLIATILSAIVFAAIFSAYIFMARNLTRMANFQQQQVQNRKAFFVVGQDVSGASVLVNASPTILVLTIPAPPPPSLDPPTTITYTYDGVAHTLTRQAVGPAPSTYVLLSNLTNFTFAYYDKSGIPNGFTTNIKQVEMRYSSAVGDNANGTQSSDTVVSARMILRGVASFGG